MSSIGFSKNLRLPPRNVSSSTSVEEALVKRRPVREYSREPITLDELGQLLLTARGNTQRDSGFRTAPSAGTLYPLKPDVAASQVEDLPSGIYKYRSQDHSLVIKGEGDRRSALSEAALEQKSVRKGAAVIVIAAVYKRSQEKHDVRGIGCVHMEVGRAAQNIYLQAESLNLGTVMIGALNNESVWDLMHMDTEEALPGLMPVGTMN